MPQTLLFYIKIAKVLKFMSVVLRSFGLLSLCLLDPSTLYKYSTYANTDLIQIRNLAFYSGVLLPVLRITGLFWVVTCLF